MDFGIINGPNLNLVGTREPDIYGSLSLATYLMELQAEESTLKLHIVQSNIEGELVDRIQAFGHSTQGIILNPGAYSHSSLAIADAIAAITCPVVEVHISQVMAREDFRRHSLISKYCVGTISGLGLEGYGLALQWLKRHASHATL